MAKLTVVEAINLALKQEMEKDHRVLLLGEDVGKNGGVFRVTQGLLDIFGEARVMDTPLSESAIAGVAIGMVIFMEPKKVYRSLREEVPEEEDIIPLGETRIVHEGTDVTLITWGAMLQPTLQAAALMEQNGTRAEIIDLRTLSPLDTETIIASVKKNHRAVVVHEAPATCGVGAEIVARINEKALVYLEAPVQRVTGFDTIMPLPKLEKYYLPDAGRVIEAANRTVNF